MVEELETEDVDAGEDQQSDQAFFNEGCFRGVGHGGFKIGGR